MPRIKLTFPEKTLFESEIAVGIGDINYGKHMGNERVLVLSQEMRIRYLQSLGFRDEMDFGGHTGTIVADAAIMYKAEAFHGDMLRGSIGIDEVHQRGFDMYYRFTRLSDGKEIALAKTAILFFDYKQRKLTSIPENFLSVSGIQIT